MRREGTAMNSNNQQHERGRGSIGQRGCKKGKPIAGVKRWEALGGVGGTACLSGFWRPFYSVWFLRQRPPSACPPFPSCLGSLSSLPQLVVVVVLCLLCPAVRCLLLPAPLPLVCVVVVGTTYHSSVHAVVYCNTALAVLYNDLWRVYTYAWPLVAS
jgi:hypothetical protein